MPQFQVPQFIETESKIVGPMTLKQFLYIAAAGLLSFFLFFALKTFAWLIITALIATIAISLSFVKYNGRPLTKILGSAFGYLWKPKLYLWKKIEEPFKMPPLPQIPKEIPISPLKNIWLKLHTGQQPKPQPPQKPLLHGFHKEREEKAGMHIIEKIQERQKKD